MHRLNSLRWAALPVGLLGILSITQCVDSLSDDCTKTLTCGTESQVILDSQCQWRYPDGGIWTEGPTQDPETRRWKWPDGSETATQDFRCAPNGAGGADGGVDEPDCVEFGCDSPRQCDEPSRRCVECLNDTACAGNLPIGDAGAAGVCDTVRKECVRCVDPDDCASPTPVCKVIAEDTDRNECVECTVDTQCGDSEPVCDTSSNECTLRCTGAEPGECSGSPDKSVCNGTRGLCVECVDDGTCSGETSQCDTTSNECVQCVDNGPCTPLGQVCDETSNRCVQCETNTECEGVDGKPVCDTETNLCVECLSHTECTAPGESRCNVATHECVACTATSQCEGGAVCNTVSGVCVQCLSNAECAMMGVNTQCEPISGTCVQCTDSTQCTAAADAALCATNPADGTPFTCVGCRDNAECGKFDAFCRTTNRVCVECLELANCSGDATASFCSSGGACVPCAVDAHCAAVPNLKACSVVGNDARCVECVNNTHCVNNPDGAVCKTSEGGAAAGPGAVNTCVECVSNADCTNPSASKCVQNECVPCTADADCGIPGSNVCDRSAGPAAGVCVECTGPRNESCNGGENVCDSLAKTCTQRGVASADACQPCVSDKECATDARCVFQRFSNTDIGYFCFPLRTSPECAPPYALFTSSATIDQQQPLPTVCMLNETTCPGLNTRGVACEGPDGATNNPSCGVPGIADGVCTEDTFDVLRCAVPCEVSADCPTGLCSAGLCPI